MQKRNDLLDLAITDQDIDDLFKELYGPSPMGDTDADEEVREDMIDFRTAMRRLIPNQNGVEVPVSICPPSLFKAAVYEAIEKHPQRGHIKRDLAGLQLRYKPDRWYALELLQRYGVELPGKPGEAGETGGDERRGE